jgi:beta-galactosidase
LQTDKEYLASIRFTLSQDEKWAEKGHVVATDQFALSGLPQSNTSAKIDSKFKLDENDTCYVIAGDDYSIFFSKANGALQSYLIDGQEQVYGPLIPNFTRPLTDNDRRGWKTHIKLKEWYEAVPSLEKIEANVNQKGTVEITSLYSVIEHKVNVLIGYEVNGEGVIKVKYNLMIKDSLPNIPKIGMQCGIKKDNSHITWYGKGLYENYIDRNYGFDVRIYSQDIEDFIEPYVYPQENGNRTDVRWMFLSDLDDWGMLIVADSLLSMSAWPYTEEEITMATHTNELKDAGFITLNIDLTQMGVGGNDSWSDVSQPLEKYQIPAKDYSYTFFLKPMVAKPTVDAVYSIRF